MQEGEIEKCDKSSERRRVDSYEERWLVWPVGG